MQPHYTKYANEIQEQDVVPTDVTQKSETVPRSVVWDDLYSTVNQPEFAGGLHHTSMVTKVLPDADSEPPTLTKAELVELLLEQVGLNKREAKDMVEAFFDEISDALERGELVKLTGFGNFQLRDKVSRPGRNPKTGVEANIPARRVVTFQPSQKLKVATAESTVSSTEKPTTLTFGANPTAGPPHQHPTAATKKDQ